MVELKRCELATRVTLFSLESGKSDQYCERFDITEAQLKKMGSDAQRLELLSFKLQCVESLLAALSPASQRPSTAPIATASHPHQLHDPQSLLLGCASHHINLNPKRLVTSYDDELGRSNEYVGSKI